MTKNRFCVYLFIGVMASAVISGCTGIGTGVKTSSEPAVQAAAQSAPAAAPAVQAAPAAAPVAGTVDLSRYEKPGFTVFMEDGRLWVFRPGSKDYEQFKKSGEPARQVIRPGAGPGGITLKSTDTETLDEYVTSLPGYFTKMEDGRLWVFKADSKELAEFLAKGEPARQVIRPGAGPFGLTVKATDAVILDEYMKNWDAAAN